MNDFFEELEKWEKEFHCNECGELNQKEFGFDRTVSNGEIWICNNCDNKILVSHQPIEN